MAATNTPAALPLLNKAGEVVGHTVLDPEDAERFGGVTWRLSSQGYAVRWQRLDPSMPRVVLLHREILGISGNTTLEGDHINRVSLDNRRLNLRVARHAENMQNRPSHRGSSSQYRGVSLEKATGRWVADGKLNNKKYRLGRFATEEEAAQVAAAWRATHLPFSQDAREIESPRPARTS